MQVQHFPKILHNYQTPMRMFRGMECVINKGEGVRLTLQRLAQVHAMLGLQLINGSKLLDNMFIER